MTPSATTAGFRVSVSGRRVYLVDAEPTSDPGMSHHEAKELTQGSCAPPTPPSGPSSTTARPAAPPTKHGPRAPKGDDHHGHQQPTERFAGGFAPRPPRA
jgi:hypothetical protein